MRRSSLAVGLVAALAFSPTAAQPIGREVPRGFVLPGPPPTGGVAPSGTPGGGAPALGAGTPDAGGVAAPAGGVPAAGGAASSGAEATPSAAAARAPAGGGAAAPGEGTSAVLPREGEVPQPAAGGASAAAADPDWPCVQRKVASLDVAAIWTGPPLPAAGADWRADADVASLVDRLAQRRLPLADAQAALASFAASLPPGMRAGRLALVFAGLFERLDGERSQIMVGIERYARRQRQAAEDIRTRLSDLASRRADPAADAAALAKDQQNLEWEVRIFNDRRSSLSTICEVPRLVEQRLFALGRAATAALKEPPRP